jgi:hypothetical protein
MISDHSIDLAFYDHSIDIFTMLVEIRLMSKRLADPGTSSIVYCFVSSSFDFES